MCGTSFIDLCVVCLTVTIMVGHPTILLSHRVDVLGDILVNRDWQFLFLVKREPCFLFFVKRDYTSFFSRETWNVHIIFRDAWTGTQPPPAPLVLVTVGTRMCGIMLCVIFPYMRGCNMWKSAPCFFSFWSWYMVNLSRHSYSIIYFGVYIIT